MSSLVMLSRNGRTLYNRIRQQGSNSIGSSVVTSHQPELAARWNAIAQSLNLLLGWPGMYLFYQDESFDSNWFWLGAIAIRADQWKALSSQVLELKTATFESKIGVRKARRVRIRSNDIRQYETDRAVSPWTLLSRQEITDFVNAFYQLYNSFDVTLFFVGIEVEEHRRKYEPEARGCYEYAFEIILERMDLFLSPGQRNDVAHIFADEYQEARRKVRSNFLWYREHGTWAKGSINNIIEPPSFVSSSHCDLISLADMAAYNVFHAYRYCKPAYPYFTRILPKVYRHPSTGEVWGAGIKTLPYQKEPGLQP